MNNSTDNIVPEMYIPSLTVLVVAHLYERRYIPKDKKCLTIMYEHVSQGREFAKLVQLRCKMIAHACTEVHAASTQERSCTKDSSVLPENEKAENVTNNDCATELANNITNVDPTHNSDKPNEDPSAKLDVADNSTDGKSVLNIVPEVDETTTVQGNEEQSSSDIVPMSVALRMMVDDVVKQESITVEVGGPDTNITQDSVDRFVQSAVISKDPNASDATNTTAAALPVSGHDKSSDSDCILV